MGPSWRSPAAWAIGFAWNTPQARSSTKTPDTSVMSAFPDHGIFGDDRGTVSIFDLQGHRRVLTKDFESAQGLAWSGNGKEIWFTASDAAELNSLRAVDLGGETRIVAAAP